MKDESEAIVKVRIAVIELFGSGGKGVVIVKVWVEVVGCKRRCLK
jgi:hypothetical protein